MKKLPLLIVILLLVGNAVFWGAQKEGFHTDEMFSYEQVGNTEYPKPEYDREDEPSMNHWHSREYYADYLTVDADEAFALGKFYESASTNTAHPPLYLTLFGMYISAFFRNDFTKWSGISLNIIFYILTLAVLYDLAKRTGKSEKAAVFTVLLYGASAAAVSTVVFVRVYMILTFLCVSYLDIHAFLLTGDPDAQGSKARRALTYAMLFLCFLLGCLSQYYFLIFAFFVSLCYGLILLIGKKYRTAVVYVLTLAASLLAYLGMWPYVFRDVFSGDRGSQVLYYAANNVEKYSAALLRFIRLFDRYTLGGLGLGIVALLIAIKLALAYSPRIEMKNDGSVELRCRRPARFLESEITNTVSPEGLVIGTVFFSGVFYLLVISKISPRFSDFSAELRYVANVIPGAALVLVSFLNKTLLKTKKYWKIIAGVLLAGATLLGYYTAGVNYLYKGTNEQLAELEAYSGIKAVYVQHEGYFTSNLTQYLAMAPASYVTYLSEAPQAIEDIEKTGDSEFLVYIESELMEGSSSRAQAEVFSFLEELEPKECTYLFSTATLHPAITYLVRR